MKIGILTRIDHDEAGVMDVSVRAFDTKAAAQDAMIADFANAKSEKFPDKDSIFDESCDADEAYIVGMDDSEIAWRVYEKEVEGCS